MADADEPRGRLSRFFRRHPRVAGALVTVTGLAIVGFDLGIIGGLRSDPSISWAQDVGIGAIVDAVILALGIAAIVGRRTWWRPLVVMVLIAVAVILFVLWAWNHPRRRFVRNYQVTDDVGLVMYVITMTFSAAFLLAGLWVLLLGRRGLPWLRRDSDD